MESNDYISKETLELYFAAKNLKLKESNDQEEISPRITLQILKENFYQELGRTEILKDFKKSPFKNKIIAPFQFEEHQFLKIIVDNVTQNSKKLIGSAIFELGHVVGTGTRFLKIFLKNGNDVTGEVKIKFKKTGSEEYEYTIDLR